MHALLSRQLVDIVYSFVVIVVTALMSLLKKQTYMCTCHLDRWHCHKHPTMHRPYKHVDTKGLLIRRLSVRQTFVCLPMLAMYLLNEKLILMYISNVVAILSLLENVSLAFLSCM